MKLTTPEAAGGDAACHHLLSAGTDEHLVLQRFALAYGQSLVLQSRFEDLVIPFGTHVPESLFSSDEG